jgi:WhiB family transcriptional regulator, redox-sensing transcriptional regulator
VTAVLSSQRWRDRAACLGMDTNLFFPEGGPAAKARRVCAACPVRLECGEHARSAPEPWGVWGGIPERERRRPRTRRSAFPGVTWNRKLGKWVARATVGGRRRHLGVFTDEAAAGRAVVKASAAPAASPSPQPRKAVA